MPNQAKPFNLFWPIFPHHCQDVLSSSPSHYLVFSLSKILFLSLISLKSFFFLSFFLGLFCSSTRWSKQMQKIQTF
ncbi:hypothetical protein L6452_21948 [Arctium lappa]|uniref:Uncharacterized protein n=1 Tax=Arctium lappa TaxID=4217 RepID=A0ACB9B2S8_ARCLA|nr:hypothetical protein L6452_21948 [Arctium lappa]